jgi:hypothetical protein
MTAPLMAIFVCRTLHKDFTMKTWRGDLKSSAEQCHKRTIRIQQDKANNHVTITADLPTTASDHATTSIGEGCFHRELDMVTISIETGFDCVRRCVESGEEVLVQIFLNNE